MQQIVLTGTPGYYNPLLAHGEEKSIQDAAEAGANGFIIVDLPPEEAVSFREKCTKVKLVTSLYSFDQLVLSGH